MLSARTNEPAAQPPSRTGPGRAMLAAIRQRLLRQALVFDDPRSYVAGVEDALEAVDHDMAAPARVPTRKVGS